MSDFQPTVFVRERKKDLVLEQKLIHDHVHPLVARVLSARPLAHGVSPAEFLKADLSSLQAPDDLPNVEVAAKRIAEAVINKELIAFVSDFDNDGQVSLCVFMTVLESYFAYPMENFTPFIGDRLTEGYGLSDKLCDRLLSNKPLPALIITGDCGSSDEPRIKRLKDANCSVIVSDHHAFPSAGPPASAYAVVSPIYPNSKYDSMISGGMVTWLLMVRVRQELIKDGYLDKDSPRLGGVLDYVGSATIADCVGMNSVNNRAVVKSGLAKINRQTRPAWKAFVNHNNAKKIRASDLAFSLGPMLNSDGRLSNAFGSVSFLLSPDNKSADEYLAHLIQSNEERKKLERKATIEAKRRAAQRLTDKSRSLLVFLEDGHPGVSGIIASRLKDFFGLPSIVLAPSSRDEGRVVGSARGIDYTEFHVLQALRYIKDKSPELLAEFGGHKNAAGMSLNVDKIDAFSTMFEESCFQQLGDRKLGPVIETDGSLSDYIIDLDLLQELETLEPTGRGFEAPKFELVARVVELRPIGKTQTHLQLTLLSHSRKQNITAIWFNARENSETGFPVDEGLSGNFIGSLSINEWRGTQSVRFMVSHFVAADDKSGIS